MQEQRREDAAEMDDLKADLSAVTEKAASMAHKLELNKSATAGQSITHYNITPFFFKMAQNLDLGCVLVPAP